MLHIFMRSANLGWNFHAGHRLANLLELRWRFQGGFAADGAAQSWALGQLTVTDAGTRGGSGHTLRGLNLIGRYAQALGRALNQSQACLGSGLAHLRTGQHDGQAAKSANLVRAQIGVTHDQLDVGNRHIQLFGNHLGQSGAHTGAQLDLAGVKRDHAIGRDLEPSIDLGKTRISGLLGQHGRQAQAEADHHAGRGLEECAPLHAATPAALRTAEMMRMWVPQRHRLASSAALIWSSVGLGVFFKKATVVITMPLMQ